MVKKTLIGCLIGCFIILICYVLVVMALSLGFMAAMRPDNLTKEEIFEVVNNNYEKILSDVHKGDFTKTNKIKGVKDVRIDDGVIDFYCGGKGNVASGAYFGFYYTEDDLPKVSFLPVLFNEEDLVPKDKGYCFDKYDYFYTEKIRDNIYFYESYY